MVLRVCNCGNHVDEIMLLSLMLTVNMVKLNSMVQHPVARVLQKFINLHRTQLQSYLFVYFIFIFNLNHTTCFGPSLGHPQV
jgi:hypothetical protein